MSIGPDPRLGRFVRGELEGEELAALECELDERPSLRLALAACAGDPSTVLEGAPNEHRSLPRPAPVSSDAVLDGPERLALGETLGEGGMGTVRHGFQTNLGRAVAVKSLRHETPSGTHRLLQEARLTARLQHPNIVPVHEILEGHCGELQVVLKQVEGALWKSVMHEPAVLRARFGVEDALDWNLGVLVAVCNALAYAHERGVIHRDVKPSNVMVGNFGEIYLLDWGIAAVWGERTDPELAHVEDTLIAGTPSYMAPEQLEGDADFLGPWTDTYLLGATLYELLGGRAPHADTSIQESRARPRDRTVAPLGADAPRELVAIVTQSLTNDPEDRLLSPQAFRALVEAFRSHRGSLGLADRAERSLRLATSAAVEVEALEKDRHLGEAEFGFRAALEAWPDNERARVGLRQVAAHRIDAALVDGHVQAARRLLDALADPPASLVRRVELASSAEDAQRAAANRAAWHGNLKVGAAVRGALVAVFSPVWVLGWLALAIWPADTKRPIVALLVGFLVFGVGIVGSRGLDFLKNRLNKSNVLGAGAGVVAALAWTLSAAHLGLGMAETQLGILLVLALTASVITVTADLRGLPIAVVNFGLFVVASVAPAYARHALAASAVVVAGSLIVNNLLLRRRSRTSSPPESSKPASPS